MSIGTSLTSLDYGRGIRTARIANQSRTMRTSWRAMARLCKRRVNMTRIKFSDGAQFDTSGGYRVERRRGGYYVVGHGFLCQVTDKADGERLIVDLNAARRKRLSSGRQRRA